jgi:hypothetical protein
LRFDYPDKTIRTNTKVAVANLGNLISGQVQLAISVKDEHEVISGAVPLGEAD